MVDAELLALLVCPDTHQDLTLATPEETGAINLAIRQERLRNRAGEVVRDPIDGALIRHDRTVAYPVREGIPVMLIPEGLALPAVGLFPGAEQASHV